MSDPSQIFHNPSRQIFEKKTKLVLGINQDQYDCGVTLTDGNKVLYSANEERFTRLKNHGGFPRYSIEGMFRYTGVEPSDIELICVAGEMTPSLPARIFPGMQNWVWKVKRKKKNSFSKGLVDFIIFNTPVAHTSSNSISRKLVKPFLVPILRRTLPKSLRHAPISFVEHHHAHAAAAWYLSGFGETLVVTGDGMGDGLSLTVSRCSSRGIEHLWSAASNASFGLFFEMLTEAFGFVPSRDEGKLTGLAAGGDKDRVTVPSPFQLSDGRLNYTGPCGRRGVTWVKEVLLSRFSREDVSAWAQELLESNVLKITHLWLRNTGLHRLAVGGGIFANVKLNQRLNEMDEVEELYVCPNMGDGGLSLGAVCARGGLTRQKISDVFWGDSYDDLQIDRVLREEGLRYRECHNIERDVAHLVAQGKIVARFVGRMEWGPRALGNRSILTQTSDTKVVQRLNDLLCRSDFMPFAPACLEEDVEKYVIAHRSARHAAEFMTVCFSCTERMHKENPAVVHTDNTARMQIVREETNPSFWRILKEYKQITGNGILLNTSFNIHEEPIVRIPEEAVAAFAKARLDYLAIGNYLVPGEHIIDFQINIKETDQACTFSHRHVFT